MKRCYSMILVSCLVAAATTALAEEKTPSSTGGDDTVIQANCDIASYKHEVQTFTPAVPVPDNTGVAVTVGPILTFDEPNTIIADVIIDLRMSHTWIGDIIATVQFDAGCDQTIDASATIIGRPGRVGACTPAGTPFGCSTDLVVANQLMFDDTAANFLGTNADSPPVCNTAAVNPAGCYKPTGSCASPLAIFKNRGKGGCWTLKVQDMGGGDLGTIAEWSVHIKNQTQIATAPVTWSTAKVLFN